MSMYLASCKVNDGICGKMDNIRMVSLAFLSFYFFVCVQKDDEMSLLPHTPRFLYCSQLTTFLPFQYIFAIDIKIAPALLNVY